jgi:hypothetical protein
MRPEEKGGPACGYDWYHPQADDRWPDGLRDTPTAIALHAIIDLDLEELAAVAPPRGYGRD